MIFVFIDFSQSIRSKINVQMGSEGYGYTILYNFGHVPNDGIVPKWSVEELNNYTNRGNNAHCHTDLLSSQEYNLSKNVLMSGR
jgi:hypothetical protein